jgi:hypothetical protein
MIIRDIAQLSRRGRSAAAMASADHASDLRSGIVSIEQGHGHVVFDSHRRGNTG